uniref:Exostosin GT47 domain-containing protein n=1 Tax=Leersia perrieri TaxID=77586 RepID=A0A0D9X886_9ORYZ
MSSRKKKKKKNEHTGMYLSRGSRRRCLALTRRLLIDLSSRRRLFILHADAGKSSTKRQLKKKSRFHEALNLAGFLRCSHALVSWMAAERKTQPSPATATAPPPSPAEHRRLLRYVAFVALSLLAFSCWALVSSRIDAAVLAATGAGEDDAIGIRISSSQAAMPASGGGNATVSPSAMMTRQHPSGETAACDAESAQLRVFVYDLPPEFHFGMLGWRGAATWPDVGDPRAVPRYPGGLNLQHSVEYWLTLDILSSTSSAVAGDLRRPCTAVRVTNASRADVFLVPFFASLSYNRQSKPHGGHGELVKYLVRKEEWRRWGGTNHLLVPHHPNSMMDARRRLSAAMFVLSDFGRYTPKVANLRKDVIAPYKHVVPSLGDGDSPRFEQRPVLAYFQGAIHRKDGGRVRQKLYNLIKDEKDVHFTYGSVRQNGIRRATKGMASSKFCLNIAGDTPSSNRLFDAIVSHCVPVIISDDIELPFEDVLDYSEFCVFVRASDAVKKGFLLRLLRGITHEEWTVMWRRLKEVAHHFEYQYPSQPGDAVQMIWGAVARKMHSVKLQLHKRGRYHRTLSES